LTGFSGNLTNSLYAWRKNSWGHFGAAMN